MTEEERREAIAEGLGATWTEPGDWEPISVLAAPWCGHNVIRLVLDDWSLMGEACSLALCVVCGVGLVRWAPQDEGRSSSDAASEGRL